jgi:hypothetical protein
VSKTIVAACLALAAVSSTSWAKTACVPSATLSSGPRVISLVGLNGSADPVGAVTYVVRDLAGIPVPGSSVMLNFSNCTDVRIDADPDPNVTVNCAARTIWAVTDYSGSVTIRIVGSGVDGASRTLPTCASVTVDGVPLPSPVVSAFDLDGRNGVNGMDLSLFGADLVSGQYRPRCDYDGDGDVDGLDLGLLGRALTGGGSVSSGTACP